MLEVGYVVHCPLNKINSRWKAMVEAGYAIRGTRKEN